MSQFGTPSRPMSIIGSPEDDERKRQRILASGGLSTGFASDPGFRQEAAPRPMPQTPTRQGQTPAQLAGAASTLRPREPDRSFGGQRPELQSMIRESEATIGANRRRMSLLRTQAQRAEGRGDFTTATQLRDQFEQLNQSIQSETERLVRWRRAMGGRTTAFQSEQELMDGQERLKAHYRDEARPTMIAGAAERLREAVQSEGAQGADNNLQMARMFMSRITPTPGAELNISDSQALQLWQNAKALNDPAVAAIENQFNVQSRGGAERFAANARRNTEEARAALEVAQGTAPELTLDPIDQRAREESQQRDFDAVDRTMTDLDQRRERIEMAQALETMPAQVRLSEGAAQIAENRRIEAENRAITEGARTEAEMLARPDVREARKEQGYQQILAGTAGFIAEKAEANLRAAVSEQAMTQVLGEVDPPMTPDDVATLTTRLRDQAKFFANPRLFTEGGANESQAASNLTAMTMNLNAVRAMPPNERRAMAREIVQLFSQEGFTRPQTDSIPYSTMMAIVGDTAWRNLFGAVTLPTGNIRNPVSTARETMRIRRAVAGIYDEFVRMANE